MKKFPYLSDDTFGSNGSFISSRSSSMKIDDSLILQFLFHSHEFLVSIACTFLAWNWWHEVLISWGWL
ncbi:hypothetical protein AB4211_08600 [Vibrio lentus]